jgi:hypothetical protein
MSNQQFTSYRTQNPELKITQRTPEDTGRTTEKYQ